MDDIKFNVYLFYMEPITESDILKVVGSRKAESQVAEIEYFGIWMNPEQVLAPDSGNFS
jgi:hypothetical protein